MQQVMSHEEDILSDNLDLLLVVDLLRVVRSREDEATAEHGEEAPGRCRWRESHTRAPLWDTRRRGAAAGGTDDAREGERSPEMRNPGSLLRPLFVSCTPTTAHPTAAAGGMPGGGVAGAWQADCFPCSPSSHIFGGRPTSVLAAAAAGAALIESLDVSHRSLDGLSTSEALALIKGAGDFSGAEGGEGEEVQWGGADAVLTAVCELEAERLDFLLALPGELEGGGAGARGQGYACAGDGAEGPTRRDAALWKLVYRRQHRLPSPPLYHSSRASASGDAGAQRPLGEGAEEAEGAEGAGAEGGGVGGWTTREPGPEGIMKQGGNGVGWLADVGRALEDLRVLAQRGELEVGKGRGAGGREGWEGGRDSNVLTVVGHPGRLGNWLFRAASGLGLAWDTGNTFLGVFLI
jgi:hypothetical protein